MPKNQEKQKVVKTTPSQGILQRIFGSSTMTPEMEQGINIARKENPNLAPVQPYGMISRIMQPNAMGYTSPGRTIYLNPRTMEGQNPQDVADTLLHEQTHVNQMNQRGFGPTREFLHEAFSGNEPYHRRPDEIEAYQSEVQRRARMGRMPTAVPSFETGEMITPGDIYLRSSKKMINTGPSNRK
jgi:hypothetical protein